MRKAIIKITYLVIVFIAALCSISAVMNKGNTDMTMEMREATFPVVTMQVDGHQVNRLHGYANAMNTRYLRDTLLPIGMDRRVSFTIDTYDNPITEISFEVRSINGERLVESTEIEHYDEIGDQIKCEIILKDLISMDEEYMLILFLTPEGKDTIRYYTRIVQSEEMNIEEKLSYVLDFHNRTFDREAAAELTKYLESNAEGDNSTLHHVTIHSSFKQVTWGDLTVERVTEPIVYIQDLEERTGSFRIEYMVVSRNAREKAYYQVQEYYRIRYTPERMYLLDFEREMTQIFDETTDVFTNDKIMLGIVDKQVEMEESDGGNVFAFVTSNKLYSYNVTDHKIARLFSFYEEDVTDVRSSYTQHKIKILNVDEAGNVLFLVYGYMNRGRHEGEVGVSAYFYNSMTNTVEEMVYIPYNRSSELLESDVDKLAYISKSSICYLMLEGNVYAIDLESKDYAVIVSGLTEDNYKVSKSNQMLVWQEGVDQNKCTTLKVLNLGTEQETRIEAGNGEYISLLGFMGEDLIYGVARTEDRVRDNTGNIVFPMYRVRIQNENGEVLKNYAEPGIYVTGSEIQDNQINLFRLRKEENGNYTEIENDQIVNTKIMAEGNNVLETVAIDTYGKIVQIAVKSTIDAKTVKRLRPKEVLFEGGREIVLQESRTEVSRYYVYGKEGVEGIFTDEGNAIDLAYSLSGIVVNEKGAYVWSRGNRSLKNQIMAIKGASITEEKNSLAICLDTMLQYEGIMRNTEYMLNRGETIVEILEENLEGARVLDLTGCSLDAILYYVNKDIPVLASMNDGNAVLIIGFNELNTVLMDPLTGGTPFKKGMNDSTQMFAENGNRFITYMKE